MLITIFSAHQGGREGGLKGESEGEKERAADMERSGERERERERDDSTHLRFLFSFHLVTASQLDKFCDNRLLQGRSMVIL